MKTLSWRCLKDYSPRRLILGLMDVFWMNFWTSWKRLEDVLGIRCVSAGLVQLMAHKWRCATISNDGESFHRHQQATSHYLNQSWNIVNGTVRNKFQWYIHRNSHIFVQENAFENVACEMTAILSQSQWVNVKNVFIRHVILNPITKCPMTTLKFPNMSTIHFSVTDLLSRPFLWLGFL